MAKITAYIPEPKNDYQVENQRQIVAALDTMKNQLNSSFQEELKQELERFTFYMIQDN
jgi:hypothetical protein|tara:strand:- start:155 stop:328 length:174 start_codon:yes stop_codon:yes gene_type:complete